MAAPPKTHHCVASGPTFYRCVSARAFDLVQWGQHRKRSKSAGGVNGINIKCATM